MKPHDYDWKVIVTRQQVSGMKSNDYYKVAATRVRLHGVETHDYTGKFNVT